MTRRTITLTIAMLLLFAAAALRGPDGGTGRHNNQRKEVKP